MTKSRTKLLIGPLKGATVKRSVMRKAVEEVYGIKSNRKKMLKRDGQIQS